MTQQLPKAVGAAAAILMAGALLTGCSDAAGEPDALTIWAAQSTPDAVKDAIAAYADEAGVEMELEIIPDPFDSTLLTRWTAGQRPDILFGQPGPGFLLKLNAAKNLQDLGDMEFVDRTRFGLADSGSLDGVHYTATYGFPAVFGVYYNTAVFEQHGIAVPETTDELDAAAEALDAAGVAPWGFTGGDVWTTQLGWLEGLTGAVADGKVEELNDGTAAWTDPAFAYAASVIPSWVQNGWLNPDYQTALYADMPERLQSGEIGMYAMASWMNSMFTDDTDIGFFPYPSDSGKVQWQSSNNTSVQLPITGDEAAEQASREFVDWLTVGEGYIRLLQATGEPSIIEGVDDPAEMSKLARLAAEAFANGGVASLDQQLLYSPANRADLLNALIAGNITPDQFNEQYEAATVELRELNG